MSLENAEAIIPVVLDTSNVERDLVAGTRGALRDAERQITSSMDRALTRTGQGMSTFGKTMTVGVTAPLVAGFATLATSVMEYDEAVLRAVSLEGLDDKAANAALEEVVRGQIDAAREHWGVGGAEAASAYFTGVSGGLGDNGSKEMEDALDAAAELALAGNTTIDASMGLLVRAAQTFKKENLSAAEAADIYVAAANESLVSLDEMAPALSQAGSAAASAGVPLAEMSAAMSTLSMSMELGSASAGLKGIFTELNRDGTDLNDTLKTMGHDTVESAISEFGSFQQVLEAMFQATGANEVGFKNLFGQVEAADAALLLVGENAPGAQQALDSVRDSAGAAGRAAAVIYDSTSQQNKRMWQDLMTDMEPVVRDMLPQLIEVAKDLLPIVQDIVGKLADLSDATNGWGLVGLAAIGPVSSGFGSLLQMLGQRGMIQALGALGPASNAAGAGMVSGLSPAIAAAARLSAHLAAAYAGWQIGSWINDKTGVGDKLGDWVADRIVNEDGSIKGIPGLADGGHVTRSGWTMVGEEGAELLELPRGSTVRPLDGRPGTPELGGGGVTVSATINIYPQGALDEVAVKALAPTVAAELDRITRTRTARRRP